MLNDMGGWFELAIVAGRLILFALKQAESPRQHSCSRVRYRSFRAWGIEWTSYYCDDDRHQS